MMIFLLFFVVLLGILLGFPVAFSLGISSLLVMIIEELPLQALSMRMFSGLNSYQLLAIPFFIFLGTNMNKCGITQDLIDLLQSSIGFMRSSLAQVNIMVSLFLSGVSGSNLADASSVGAILIPTMINNGYTREEAAVITGTSSAIGPIFPPSTMMVLFGSFTQTPIFGLFLAGVFPGLILTLALMGTTYLRSRFVPDSMGNTSQKDIESISIKEIIASLKNSIFALPIPVILLGGIYFGFFTVTEAGAVGALYSLIVGVLVYELKINDFLDSLLETCKTVSLVGTVIAFAYVFSYLLSTQQFASIIMSQLQVLGDSPGVILFIIIFTFFLLGCFIPTTVVLIIFSPFFSEILALTGLEIYQLALLILLSLEMGVMTPPYGTILYIVSYIADTSVIKCIPVLIQYLIPLVIVIILVALFPALTMLLPEILI